MATPFERIELPELFLGFVAPVGADLGGSIRSFSDYFRGQGYNVIELKVTEAFEVLQKYLQPKEPLVHKPLFDRYNRFIAYGNQVRAHFGDDEILASLTVLRIIQERQARIQQTKDLSSGPAKNVYLIHQFKRKEEIELLRSVYGRTFFQISVYSRRGARVDFLARKFAHDENSVNIDHFRSNAEKIVQMDNDQVGVEHGQRVSSIFHDGDVIFNSDLETEELEKQIRRFCDLLFGSNKISPTKEEYGMFAAKAAALRTLDLSRQIGAAIFSPNGEIISMGSNEVPKAHGGTYWGDGDFDDRDYVRKQDTNDRHKQEVLAEILEILGMEKNLDPAIATKLGGTQLMNALEYGRIIHAEMSAICDAARLGRSIQGATLFTTTYPCHMCAKHIVASGVAKVIFLEPYPKSLTAELHGDSVVIEGGDRGKYNTFPFVEFTHFHGVSPRRYREIFERTKRKDAEGTFVEWKNGSKRPFVDLKFPFYLELEKAVLKTTTAYLESIKMQPEMFAELTKKNNT